MLQEETDEAETFREKINEGAGEWTESKGQDESDKNGRVRRSPLGEFTPA